MIIEGKFTINAPLDQVWNFFLDIKSVASCVPGCESIEPLDNNSYTAHIKAKVGPLSASFKVVITITDLKPFEYIKSTMKGQDSKIASNFFASNVLTLQSLGPQETEVYYRSEVSVLGRLGMFGEGVMKKKAKELGEQFVVAMKNQLESISLKDEKKHD